MPYVDSNTKIIVKKFCVFALSTLLSIGLLIPPRSLAQDANKTQPSKEPKQMSSAVELKAGASVEVASTSPSLSSILTQTVIFIYKDNTPQNATRLVPGTVLGTAFIVGVPLLERPDKSIPFIVTAKHVIADQSKVLARYTQKSAAEPVYFQYDLDSLRKSGDLWEYPNDEGVDIVVFRTLAYENVKFLVFPVDLIASKETFAQEYIDISDRIMIPCLMADFPGITQNYPIFRDGTIALITEEPISFTWKLGTREIKTSQRVIFINSLLNEGFSGAPVFLWPGMRSTPKGATIGGKPWLIGIVHGFFPQLRNVIDADGKNVIIIKQEPGLPGQVKPPKQLSVYSQENPGTGIIFPSWRLLDIFQCDVIKKRVQELTDEEIAKEKKN
jgi:hypothetical protein